MPETINFKVDIPGREVQRLGARTPSMKSIAQFIRSHHYHKELENELIRRASSYPTSALPKFMNEIVRHIEESQNALRKS